VSIANEFERVVIDHGRRPRHRGILADADATGEARHPMSGEHFTVGVAFDAEGRIGDIRFEGDGTVLSVASASLMTQKALGKTPQEVEALAAVFLEVVSGPPDESPDASIDPELAAFAGIRQYPVRIPCALLGWQALHRALQGYLHAAVCKG